MEYRVCVEMDESDDWHFEIYIKEAIRQCDIEFGKIKRIKYGAFDMLVKFLEENYHIKIKDKNLDVRVALEQSFAIRGKDLFINKNKFLKNFVNIKNNKSQEKIQSLIVQNSKKENDENELYVEVLFNKIHSCKKSQSNNKLINIENKNVKFDTINLFTGTKEIINVFQCNNCGKYWISSSKLSEYTKKFYMPNFKVKLPQMNPEEWKQHSLLNMFGYNVQHGDMPASRRRAIIDYMLDNKVMGADEIISLLQFNIKLRYNSNNLKEAVKKWQSDIDYIYTDYKKR